MVWWHWIVVGLILIALEMAASGGFYVIFFGIAAIAIGALHALDLGYETPSAFIEAFRRAFGTTPGKYFA